MPNTTDVREDEPKDDGIDGDRGSSGSMLRNEAS
jgi:hypothetical protein